MSSNSNVPAQRVEPHAPDAPTVSGPPQLVPCVFHQSLGRSNVGTRATIRRPIGVTKKRVQLFSPHRELSMHNFSIPTLPCIFQQKKMSGVSPPRQYG